VESSFVTTPIADEDRIEAIDLTNELAPSPPSKRKSVIDCGLPFLKPSGLTTGLIKPQGGAVFAALAKRLRQPVPLSSSPLPVSTDTLLPTTTYSSATITRPPSPDTVELLTAVRALEELNAVELLPNHLEVAVDLSPSPNPLEFVDGIDLTVEVLEEADILTYASPPASPEDCHGLWNLLGYNSEVLSSSSSSSSSDDDED
jgi:hypothetical protein